MLKKNVLSVYDTITGEKLKDVKVLNLKIVFIYLQQIHNIFKSKKNNIAKWI